MLWCLRNRVVRVDEDYSRRIHPAVRPVDDDPVGVEDVASLLTGLAALRAPMTAVEKLPKPKWRGAWDGGRASRCQECGGYHVIENTIHLSYCGHAAVTDRLLDVDSLWTWEPLAVTPEGLPLFDKFGGLWIKLTVLGVTRLGYGDATGKPAGSTAVKEIIGDAIRNAAMRFGVALDLWSKADLHEDKNPGEVTEVGDRSITARHVRQGLADALASLRSVCETNGLDMRAVADRFETDTGVTLRSAEPDQVTAFTKMLIAECNPDDMADGNAELF